MDRMLRWIFIVKVSSVSRLFHWLRSFQRDEFRLSRSRLIVSLPITGMKRGSIMVSWLEVIDSLICLICFFNLFDFNEFILLAEKIN